MRRRVRELRREQILRHVSRRHRARLDERLVAAGGLVLGETRRRIGEERWARRASHGAPRRSPVRRPADVRAVWWSTATIVAQPQPPRHSTVRSVTFPSWLVSPARQPSSNSNASTTCCAPTTAQETFVHTSIEVLADRCELELVVERRDRLAVRRRQLERVGDLAQHVRREPAVLLLRKPQRRQDGRARVRRILRPLRLDGGRGVCHRSTSPITVSSEPTIAIMSAISASPCTSPSPAVRRTTAPELDAPRLAPPSEQT